MTVPGTPYDTCKETEAPPPKKEKVELGDPPEHRNDGLRVSCLLSKTDAGKLAETQKGAPPASLLTDFVEEQLGKKKK